MQPLTLGTLAEGGQSVLEMLQESLERELKEQPPGTMCWVIPHTTKATILRQSTPLHLASAYGEVITPPKELLCSTLWCLSPAAD